MIWFFTVGLFVLCIVWFMKRPSYNRINMTDFTRYLVELINLFDDGAVLIFRHKPSKTFVQFAKYVKNDVIYLHYGFPLANWSSRYFKAVIKALDSVDLVVEQVETKTCQVPMFLEINWENPQENEINQAATAASKTFEAMGISDNDYLFVNISGSRDTDAMLSEMKKMQKGMEIKNRSDKVVNKIAIKCIERMENKKGKT